MLGGWILHLSDGVLMLNEGIAFGLIRFIDYY
jgi:hypothetical protein